MRLSHDRNHRRAVVGSLAAAATALATAVLVTPAAASTPARDSTVRSGETVRVIVTTKAPSTATLAARRATEQVTSRGGVVHHVYRTALDGYAATIPADQVDNLLAEPTVLAVEEDQLGRGADVQDPAASWGLDRIDQRTLPLAGGYGYRNAGRGVTSYIFDSGVRLTHTEFTGRIRTGPDFVDDDASSDDCHGHGTHVAGTTAGTRYGVAKKTDLVAVRVLACDNTGWYSDWIEAIDWINSDHAAGVPAVVNASLGGGFSGALNSAVSSSIADGIVWVIAAHNYNTDACTFSPASVPEAITVAASDPADQRAGFSNYVSCVDIFAPGVAIDSAGIASDTAVAPGWSGTSMAAPHVSGVVARYLREHTSATPGEVADRLIAEATIGVISDALSPNRMLYVARTVPGRTAIRTAAPGRAGRPVTATARWGQPATDGGSPTLGYRVRALRINNVGGVIGVKVSALRPPHTRTFQMRLPKGRYRFQVAAVNDLGRGPWSARSNIVRAR